MFYETFVSRAARTRKTPVPAKHFIAQTNRIARAIGILALVSLGSTQSVFAGSDFTSVLAGQLSDGRIQLFTAAGNSSWSLETEWKVGDAYSAWSGWQTFLNPGVYGRTGGELGAAVQWPNANRTLQIFVPEDTFGGIMTSWKTGDSHSPWTAYQSLTNEHDQVVSVAAGPLNNGQIQVFWSTGPTGPQPNSLLTAWIGSPQDTWTAGARLDPQPPVWLSHLTAAPLPDGRLQLWGANGGDIWTTYKETTQANSGWVPWEHFSSFAPDVQSLAVSTLPDGRLQLFSATSNGFVNTCWKETTDPKAWWSPWNPLIAGGSSVFSFTTFRSLAVAPLSDGRLQLWMLDLGGNLFSTWKTTTDPLSSWYPVSTFPLP